MRGPYRFSHRVGDTELRPVMACLVSEQLLCAYGQAIPPLTAEACYKLLPIAPRMSSVTGHLSMSIPYAQLPYHRTAVTSEAAQCQQTRSQEDASAHRMHRQPCACATTQQCSLHTLTRLTPETYALSMRPGAISKQTHAVSGGVHTAHSTPCVRGPHPITRSQVSGPRAACHLSFIAQYIPP